MPPKPTIDVSTFTEEQKRAVQNAAQLGSGVNVVSAPVSPQIPATSVATVANPPQAFTVPAPTPAPVPDTRFLDTAFKQSQEEIKAQQGVDTSLEALRSLTNQATQQGTRRAELATAEGIPDMTKQVRELYNQIQQNNVQSFTGQQIAEERLAPNFVIRENQQSLERQRAVKNFALSAAAEALQGNIALAQARVDSAIQAEFQPIQARIDFQKQLIQDNYNRLTVASKSAADKRLVALNERERLLNEDKTEKANINQVLLTAAQSGADNLTIQRITSARSVGEAVSYAQPFIEKRNTQVVKFDNGDSALIDTQSGQVIKNFGGSKIADTVNKFSNTGLGIATSVLNSKFNSKFQQEQFTNNVNRFINAQDDKGLANYIFSTAIETLPDAEQRKKALSQYRIVTKLTDLQKQLDEYQAKGGKTGLYRGTREEIYAALGQVKDPELRRIGTQLQDTLDQLARDRTGAVITESEEKFYNRLLPTASKSAELNRATISGLKGSMVNDLNASLRFQLTDQGFKDIQPYLDLEPVSSVSTASQQDPAMMIYNNIVGQSAQQSPEEAQRSWINKWFIGI